LTLVEVKGKTSTGSSTTSGLPKGLSNNTKTSGTSSLVGTG